MAIFAGTTVASGSGVGSDSGGGSKPLAPSNLSATAISDSQIEVTWTDNSDNEDNFRVQRSPDGSSWSTIATPGANTTSIIDTGLSSSTEYYYRVRAENEFGSSAYSNTDSATTESTPDVIAGTTPASGSGTGVNAGAIVKEPLTAGTTPATASGGATSAGAEILSPVFAGTDTASATGNSATTGATPASLFYAGTSPATATADATGVGATSVPLTRPDASKLVNDGRRAIRDGWTGDSIPNITTLVLGDDGSALSRSNDSLNNQIDSVGVTKSLLDSRTVRFTASIARSGVEEIGLKTASGDLIARSVFDEPKDIGGTVRFTFRVQNDSDVSRGVITDNGVTAVRDVLGNNNPNRPDAYAYGRDGSGVRESDSALGDEAVQVSLDEVLLRTVDSTDNWQDAITEDFATIPLTARDGRLRTQQIAWTREAENPDAIDDGATIDPNDPSEFSDENYIAFAQAGDFAAYDFEVGYDSDTDLRARIRFATDTDGQGSAAFDAVLIGPNNRERDRIEVVNDGATLSSPIWEDINEPSATLEPGIWTLRLECTTSSTALDDGVTFIDVVAPYDAAFEDDITFDDTVNANGYLSGPEKFPSLVEADFETTTTRRNITEARIASTWNNTANEQYIRARIGNDSFTRVDNSDTLSLTGGPDSNLDVRFALSRFGQTGATPTNGANGQTADIAEFFANPDAVVSDDIGETVTRAIVPPDTITGETLREAGLVDADTGTLLTRHELAEFEVQDGQRIASAETTQFTDDN